MYNTLAQNMDNDQQYIFILFYGIFVKLQELFLKELFLHQGLVR
jgi:hypothetical protein